jgi:dephospho-CoA kinase
MLVIGITGGIGSGKSLAAEFFRCRGAAILDADEVARELTRPGSALLKEIAAAFGGEVVRPDGSLDRRGLAARVFESPEAVAKLNAITHPVIMSEIERRLQALAEEGKAQVACVVAPLLLEAGGRKLVDRLLVMRADEAERVRRVVARDGLSAEEVRARMAAQMPAADQVQEADWVVDTDRGKGAALRQLEEIWERLADR